MPNFKEKYSFSQRVNESTYIKLKYPDRIPIICERYKNINKNKNKVIIPDIDKHKYLIPLDFTVGQFIYVIKQRIKLEQYVSLYLIINNTIPSSTTHLGLLYDLHKDADGFLYIEYTQENTFGVKL